MIEKILFVAALLHKILVFCIIYAFVNVTGYLKDMEYKPFNIKEEMEYGECDIMSIFGDNASVKVEYEDLIIEEDDWHIQNVFDNEANYRKSVIDYEKLTESCVRRCLHCYIIFPNSYQLLQHNATHVKVCLQNPSYFQCAECNDIFLLRFKLLQHLKNKHKYLYRKQKSVINKDGSIVTKSFHKCKTCHKILPYKMWHAHLKEVHVAPNYKCTECGRGFKTNRYLRYHMLRVHEKRFVYSKYKHNVTHERLLCSFCASEYPNKESLMTHLRNCHSNVSYNCDLCSYINTFTSLPYLRTHLYRKHKNKFHEFTCKKCSKSFKWLQLLNIHIKDCH